MSPITNSNSIAEQENNSLNNNNQSSFSRFIVKPLKNSLPHIAGITVGSLLSLKYLTPYPPEPVFFCSKNNPEPAFFCSKKDGLVLAVDGMFACYAITFISHLTFLTVSAIQGKSD